MEKGGIRACCRRSSRTGTGAEWVYAEHESRKRLRVQRVNLSMRRAYGYRSFDVMKVALFHQLGELPTPKLTHEFW